MIGTLVAFSLLATIVGWVLQGGVLISAAIIVIGILLKALQPNKFAPQKLQLFPRTFDHMWADCSSCLSSASVSQQEVRRNWLWH